MYPSLLLTLSFLAAPQLGVPTGPARPAAASVVRPQCVATIADMQSLAPPSTPVGGFACVEVLGYSSAGDGGGGLFHWNEAAGTAVDEGLVFESTHPSAPAAGRWTRRVDGALNASWWGLRGDGSNETAQLQRALDAAAGHHLVFDRAGNFGFAPAISIPSSCKLTTNDVSFRLLGDPGGASSAVVVGDRVTINELRVHAVGGFQVRRMVSLGSDNEIARLELSSANQQVTHASNLDGGLQIRGTNVHVGYLRISDFDWAALCYLASHVVIDHMRITDFVNGMHVRECNFVQLHSGQIDTPSPNATTVPGHNGVLIEGSHDVLLSKTTIHDAGEHAVRVGGLGSSRLMFSNIQAIRPGQCGFKINPNHLYKVRDVTISGLTVVDASFTSATGTNEDGLRLEHCNHVVVDGFQVQKEQLATSCHVGVYIDSCTNVTINNPKISDTNSHGIHLQDNVSVVNEIYINNPTIMIAGEHGIFIDSPTQILRDIMVMNAFIRGQNDYGIYLRANAASVGVNQPVVLNGWIKNDGAGTVAVTTTDPDVHVSVTTL